jgi:hypothetical protein
MVSCQTNFERWTYNCVLFTDGYDNVYIFKQDNMHSHGDLADVYEFTAYQANPNFEYDGVAIDIVCHPLDTDSISVHLVSLEKDKYEGCANGLCITYPSTTWVRKMAHGFAVQAMDRAKMARNEVFIKAKNKNLIAARESKPVKTLICFHREISPSIFHEPTPGRDPLQLEPKTEGLAMDYQVDADKYYIDLCMLSFHVTYKDSEKQVLDTENDERTATIAGRKLSRAKKHIHGSDQHGVEAAHERENELNVKLRKLTMENSTYERLLHGMVTTHGAVRLLELTHILLNRTPSVKLQRDATKTFSNKSKKRSGAE